MTKEERRLMTDKIINMLEQIDKINEIIKKTTLEKQT